MHHWSSSILIGVLLVVSTQSARADEPFLELIRDKAFESVQRVHSIEFTATSRITTFNYSAAGNGRTEFRSEQSYLGKDGRFRCETKLIPSDSKGQVQDFLSLFDGQRYQTFDRKTGGLQLANSSQILEPAVTPNPLVLPYMFLIFDGSRPMIWAAVQDESIWKSRFRQAKFLRTQEGKDDGPTLDVVEFPGPRPEIVFQVFFDRKLGYFPQSQVTTLKGIVSSIITVHETERVGDTAEPFVMATRTTMRTMEDDGQRLATSSQIKVARDSIKVNGPIDDALFDIPLTQAETVTDVDKKTHVQVGGVLSTKEMQSPRRSRWLASTAAVAIVTVIIGGVLIARRRIA